MRERRLPIRSPRRGRRIATAWLRLAAVLSLCVTAGCAFARAGENDGARTVGFHYSCGRWLGEPTAARVLADLRYTRPVTGEDEAAIRRQGGRVVHRFAVAVLRVELPRGAIPRLVDGEGLAEAVGVRDPRSRELRLRLRYTHPPTVEELARLRAAGARVAPQPEAVSVADAALPALLALPFVASAAPDVTFCPGE